MTQAQTIRQARTKLRSKMRKWGMNEDQIKICMVEVMQRQQAKLKGTLPEDAPLCTHPTFLDYQKAQEAKHLKKPEPKLESPDDSKYKPRRYDPLLTGPARVTGKTATAVRRKNTYTDYDYDKGEK